MKTKLIICLSFFSFGLFSQNEKPYVENFELTIYPGSGVEVEYDLYDDENDPVEVKFYNLNENGIWIQMEGVGEIGPNILAGNGKTFNVDGQINTGDPWWDPSFFKIVVNDHVSPDIQSIVDSVNPSRLYNHIDFLQGVRHRIEAPNHLEACRIYIQDILEVQSDTMYIDSFDFFGYAGKNIIGQKNGLAEKDQIFIIDGHYDSVHDSPGVDDNASGTAGMLEALEVLKEYEFEKSIQFIGFDLEEQGTKGSIDYVMKANTNAWNIIGMLNFEMIGYYSEEENSQEFPAGFQLIFPNVYEAVASNNFKGDFITNVGTENIPDLMKCYDSLATIYVPQLSVISIESPGNGSLVPDLLRSDHAPFWLSGYDAIMLTDGANFRNKNYHTPNDSLQYLDMDFMSNVVKASVATIIEKAGLVHGNQYQPENVEIVISNTEIDPCYALNYFQNDQFLHLQETDCLSEIVKLELYTTDGQLIKRQLVHCEKIDVENIEEGIYLLRINRTSGYYSQKIFIQGFH